MHRFLVDEPYWFGVAPADPAANESRLGTIADWVQQHNEMKQAGFYVDPDEAGDPVSPADISEPYAVREAIEHIHQIGWQLRLGEHIEAKQQAAEERGTPPKTEVEIDELRDLYAGIDDGVFDNQFFESMRAGTPGRKLYNDDYRLHPRAPGSDPFATLGKRGYEAQTRQLRRQEAERRAQSYSEEH